ncbi:MAG: SDR family NAD(P)-dependent oxidoreductase [Anaerolineae bacterium]|nr:SDR family NAD(P)-dependent oxidoreductase [Anaerolineae bacterium]
MKLAIISGGSKGLGLALCQQYLANGYRVVELSRSAPHPFSVQCDFAQPQAALLPIQATFAELSRADYDEIVIINNAALLGPIGPSSRKAPADVIAHLNVNVTSAILFLGQAINAFQTHTCPKSIANISSGAAIKNIFGWSLYCASKAGLEHYIRTVAIEQAEQAQPFTAINIDPDIIDTDMQAGIRQASRDDFPALDRFIMRKDIGLLRPPAQVAAAIIRILNSPMSNGARYDITDFV